MSGGAGRRIRENESMADGDPSDLEAAGNAALASGQWGEARDAFDASLSEAETAGAAFGLAAALWWLGESQASVDSSTRAYALFRRARRRRGRGAERDVVVHHLQVELRQLRRGQRVDRTRRSPPATGRDRPAARMGVDRPRLPDARPRCRGRADANAPSGRPGSSTTSTSSSLRSRSLAASTSRRATMRDGFAMIDEAMAAALGGERSSLDTVVYTCCDMLNACERGDRSGARRPVVPGRRRLHRAVRLPVPVRRVPHVLRRCARRQRPVGRRRSRAGGGAPHHRRNVSRRSTARRSPAWPLCGSGRAGSRRRTNCCSTSTTASMPTPRRRWRAPRCCSPRGDAAGAQPGARALEPMTLSRSRTTGRRSRYELLVDAHLASAELASATIAADRLTELAATRGGDRATASAADGTRPGRVRQRR